MEKEKWSVLKSICIALLVGAVVLSMWALATCAKATSITIADENCAGYSVVNNQNGSLAISCALVPPPPPPTDHCSGYATTYKMNFSVPTGGVTQKVLPGMKPGDILVVSFTTPSTLGGGGTGAGGSIGIVDQTSASRGYTGSLSTSPCSFSPGPWPAKDIVQGARTGQSSSQWAFSDYPLKINTQYYLNVTGDSQLYINLLLN